MSVTIQLFSGEVYMLPVHSVLQKLAEILQQDARLISLFANGKRVKEIAEGERYHVFVREQKHYYLRFGNGRYEIYNQDGKVVKKRVARGSIIHVPDTKDSSIVEEVIEYRKERGWGGYLSDDPDYEGEDELYDSIEFSEAVESYIEDILCININQSEFSYDIDRRDIVFD